MHGGWLEETSGLKALEHRESSQSLMDCYGRSRGEGKVKYFVVQAP